MPVHFLTSRGVRNPFATYRQLFNRMQRKAIFVGRIGLNPVIYLKPEDFAHYQGYFEPDKDQSGKWRRGGWFRHLHANPTSDGLVNVHIDSGNPNKHFIMNFPHGILDFLPWAFLIAWRLHKAPCDPTLEEMQRMLRHY